MILGIPKYMDEQKYGMANYSGRKSNCNQV